jgi:hypothetical protein
MQGVAFRIISNKLKFIGLAICWLESREFNWEADHQITNLCIFPMWKESLSQKFIGGMFQ